MNHCSYTKSFHMLIILFLFSLSTAMDSEVYHITLLPGDPCSEQPCLTISQFAAIQYSNSSSYLKPANITLIFLKGNHRLDLSLIVANVTELTMVSNCDQCSEAVLCNELTNFRFVNISHIHLRGLNFTGCGDNKVEHVHLLTIENANFLGLDNNKGRALELFETTTDIVNTAFVSNSAHDYQNSSSECDWGGGAIKAISSHVYISNCTFTHNSAPVGGAMLVWLSNVTIESSTFIKNRVTCDTSGHSTVIIGYCSHLTCYNDLIDDILLGYGGAIAAIHGQLKIHKQSIFIGNKAYGGGGLYALNVTISINDSEFRNNSAIYEGGAIDITKAILLIDDSQISGNAAEYGGALDTFSTKLNISGTKVCHNRADYSGGAVWAKRTIIIISKSEVCNNSAGGGGAMLVSYVDTLIIEQSELNNNDAGCGGLMKATSITTMIITMCSFQNNTSGSYGGAIRIYEGTTMTIEASNFSRNVANTGGAVFANSITKLIISNTIFDGNKGDSGAVYLLKVKSTFYSNTTHHNNRGSLFLSNSDARFDGRNNFIRNDGTKQTIPQQLTRFEGGAITAFQSSLVIYGHFTLDDNFAQNGGALYAAESKLYVHEQAVIANNNATNSGGGIYLYQSEVNCRDCCKLEISNNTATGMGGGIHAISSSVKAYTGESQITTSVVHFSQNSAKKGGGLCLEVNAKLYVLKTYSSKVSLYALQFTANMAEYGGAVYVADDTNSVTCASTSYQTHYTSTECFMQTLVLHGVVSSNINLVNTNFTENYAEKSGSTLYGGLLDRCTVSPSAEVYIQYDYFQAQPGAMSGAEYITSITNINATLVNSDPIRICFCNNASKPDCHLKPPVVHVPKGRNFTVPLVAVDQLNNTVPHSTIHTLPNSTESGLREGQLKQRTGEACTELTFSVFSPHQSEELILYSEGPCKDVQLSQSRLVIQFTTCECPIGFQPKAKETTRCECECDSNLEPFITDCVPQTKTLIREGSFWLTNINTIKNPKSYNYLVYPHCPYDYCHPASERVDINLNMAGGSDAQCALNRSGLLCGSCQAGLTLSIGSSRCLPCSPQWPAVLVAILIVAFLGGIAIVAILLVLNLTVALGTLNGIIFYANIVAAHNSLLLPFSQPNFITIFIAWLNLDFGFNTCFFKGMDAYWKTWLQLAFPAYVIFLVAMVIFLSERSTRFGWLIGKKNPVATLVTLILLSYAKLLHTVIAVLSFAILDYPDGSHEIVWLPDASVRYLSGKHIPLFIVAALILLAGMAYTALLFSWQWLLRHQDKKILKWVRSHKLYTFLEPYHAPYNFQHRYWTGLLLIARVILYLLIAIVSSSPGVSLLSIGVVTGCLLLYKALLHSRVYKKWPIELLELICYFNILVLSFSKLYGLLAVTGRDQMVPAFLSVSITFVLFLVVITYHLITEFFLTTKFGKKMAKLMTSQDSVSHSDILEASNDRSTYSDASEPTISIMDGPSCELSLTLKDSELERPLLEP